MCAIRRLRCLRRTVQRGSAVLPRTQLCYRLPGGGPLGRCHCCTFKDLPKPCQIRRPSKLIVFQALDTEPTTSPRESSSFLIGKRSLAGSNDYKNTGEDQETSACVSEGLSCSQPSEQIHASEQGALASIKSFVLSLINHSLRRSIETNLNPVETLTTLTLCKNEITDQDTTNPPSETLAYSGANLITDQGTKKPSESSIVQKAHVITEHSATNPPSETSIYRKAYLITNQGTTKSSERSSSKMANTSAAVKPNRWKYRNVLSTKDRMGPSEKSTFRKSHSIVHYHNKTKPSERSGNVQFKTIATQDSRNADIDCCGNCDILPILKRMHSEVDTLEARLDVLQSEITELKRESKTLGYDSDDCTELSHLVPKDCDRRTDSSCAEQVDDKEFVSDIKRLFKKYMKNNYTRYGCSQEELRRRCYRGTSLSMDPWSHPIKVYESRGRTCRVEDSRQPLPAQQFASICDLCSHTDLPILDDLEPVLQERICNRSYRDVMLIILLRDDNVYHISVQVKSSNQVLGCILATHEAIEEAIKRGCFNEILTFCLIDRCNTLKSHGGTLNWPFKFLARVNTKADKTDPSQLDVRSKNFITNVLGRQLPQ